MPQPLSPRDFFWTRSLLNRPAEATPKTNTVVAPATTPATSPVAPDALTKPSVKPSVSTPETPAVVARPDPLAVTRREGTTFTPVSQWSVAKERDTALKLGADVPGRIQDGPTCGLYALGMVMDFWDRKDARNLNPLVQETDVVRWDSHSAKPDTERRLLDVAKDRGFTTEGEMFYADQLASLSRSFGYRAEVHENITLEDIQACVDRGHPALIGFDVDNQGNPGLFGGKRAHWAVIEGHFEKEGVQYLVATHGWTGKTYTWRAEDFMASVNQLDTSDFPAAPKDITGTLKGRMVEVSSWRE